MILAVARKKRDAPSGDLAERDLVARRAVRRLDPRLVRVLHQRIESRPAEDADIGAQFISHKPLQVRLTHIILGVDLRGGYFVVQSI